jgi:hypothetical protein
VACFENVPGPARLRSCCRRVNPGTGFGFGRLAPARVDTATVASMRRTGSLTTRAFGSVKESKECSFRKLKLQNPR